MSGKNASIDRISDVVQQWFLSEPLLFSVWTTHQLVSDEKIATIRVRRGRIEVNPVFVDSLDLPTLREVMKFEAIRIVLKHPYERTKPQTELAYEASNLAIQECMHLALPVPFAEDRFGSDLHNHKHFEYYYQLLTAGQTPTMTIGRDESLEAVRGAFAAGEGDVCPDDGGGEDPASSRAERDNALRNRRCAADGHVASPESFDGRSTMNLPASPVCSPDLASPNLASYCKPEMVAIENAQNWDSDTYHCERINEVIKEIEASRNWGTVSRNTREAILATLVPRLDYRRVLRAFRANILSSQRRLTRMKPSRRYGFEYMGSRRDFSTKLLFAVDVSGSVGTADVRTAFSIVNRFFKYGIETVDVIWFDTQIRNREPIELKQASREFRIDGRGGTDFQPLMNYLDDHRQYDGLIIFSDGIAPVPTPPQHNSRTRIVWLFNHEENWKLHRVELEESGMLTAFVLAN